MNDGSFNGFQSIEEYFVSEIKKVGLKKVKLINLNQFILNKKKYKKNYIHCQVLIFITFDLMPEKNLNQITKSLGVLTLNLKVHHPQCGSRGHPD